MQAEVLIILMALFMGPASGEGPTYIFEKPTFSNKESCEQYVIENQNMLYIYVSDLFKTLPTVFPSLFYCISMDELKKFLESKPKKEIAI
jgi:hypothetical protein